MLYTYSSCLLQKEKKKGRLHPRKKKKNCDRVFAIGVIQIPIWLEVMIQKYVKPIKRDEEEEELIG